LSLDEAFVDLAAATEQLDLSLPGLPKVVAEIKAAVSDATNGLSASVGVGTSKFIAKVASELDKPDGSFIVEPGTEVQLLAPMSVRVIPGVGPVTLERLRRIGIVTVGDLQRIGSDELVQVVGKAQGHALVDLAHARDDRAVEPEREAKSISVEDTFEADVVDQQELTGVLDRHAAQVAARLQSARLFARTVTIKVRQHDFVTHTRARTLTGPTDRPDLIGDVARTLLSSVDTTAGVRLLGVGVAGLTDIVQDDLFGTSEPDVEPRGPSQALTDQTPEPEQHFPVAAPAVWLPGADVHHADYGPGWVWGSGKNRVTVRFETRETPAGPVRTFAADDPALRLLPLDAIG
jgi:DNA polymerase-4